MHAPVLFLVWHTRTLFYHTLPHTLIPPCLHCYQQTQHQQTNRYNVDPQLVQRALSRVCLPEIVEAEGPGGIKAFAEYPMWFQRRSSS